MREVGGTSARVLAAAGLAHRVGALVDPLGGHPRGEEHDARDLAVGAPGGSHRGPQHLGSLDAVDLDQCRVQRLPVGLGRPGEERAVDVEKEQQTGGRSALE